MNEIKALKAELKQTQLAYQRAMHMSQFKAGFLARTSHEIRSPLSSLIGLHQLILSDLCDDAEEEREFIRQAHESARKLMKIIDDIVAVAKTEYGRIPLETCPFELAPIFEEVKRLTYLQAGNRSLSLKIIIPEDDLYVLVDRQRLLQVLIALIDTSIERMEEGGITVTANPSSTNDYIDISIDVQCSTQIWTEPVDLLQQQPPEVTPENRTSFNQASAPSPGMQLLFVQGLLAVMGGNFKLVSIEAKDTIRLQCSIPQAVGVANHLPVED